MFLGSESFSSANFGESFVLEVVALFIIFYLVRRYIAPPLGRVMHRRADAIRAQLAAGDEARAAAKQLVAERRQALDAAHKEALSIVEQAKQSAEQLIGEGRRKSEDEYARLVSRASIEVALERNRVRDEVLREMSLIVIAGARRLVDEELDGPRHHQLIGDAIVAAESEARF